MIGLKIEVLTFRKLKKFTGGLKWGIKVLSKQLAGRSSKHDGHFFIMNLSFSKIVIKPMKSSVFERLIILFGKAI